MQKRVSSTFLSSYALKLGAKAKDHVEEPPPPSPQPPVGGARGPAPKKKEVVDPFMEDYLRRKEAQAEALKAKQRKDAAAQREKEQKEAAALELRRKNKHLEDAAAIEAAKLQAQERRARATSPVKPSVPPRDSGPNLTPAKPAKSAPPTYGASPRIVGRSNTSLDGEPKSPVLAPKPAFEVSPQRNTGASVTSPEARPPANSRHSGNPRSQSNSKGAPSKKTAEATPAFLFTAAAPQEAMLVDVVHENLHNVKDFNVDVQTNTHHESHWSPTQQTRTRFHHEEKTVVHKSVGDTTSTRSKEIQVAEAQKFEDAKRRRLSAEASEKQQRRVSSDGAASGRRASSEGATSSRRLSEPKAASRRTSSEADSNNTKAIPAVESAMSVASHSEPQPPPLESIAAAQPYDPFVVSSFKPKRKGADELNQSSSRLNQSQTIGGDLGSSTRQAAHPKQQVAKHPYGEAIPLGKHSDESLIRRIAPSQSKSDDSASRSVVGFKGLPVGKPLGPQHSRAMQPGHVRQQVNPNTHGTHSVPEGSFLMDMSAAAKPSGNAEPSYSRDDSSSLSRSNNNTHETMSHHEFTSTMASLNTVSAQRHNSTINLVKKLEDRQQAEANARANAKKNFHKNAGARAALMAALAS